MSSLSVIGLGTMGRALGTRAVAGGNAVEVIGRDAAKAADLAKSLAPAPRPEHLEPSRPVTSSSSPCTTNPRSRSSPSTETR